MTIPINMERLLHGGSVESGRIEFQEILDPDSVLHTICAFANDIDNTGGGYIVIGQTASQKSNGADAKIKRQYRTFVQKKRE